MDRNHENIRIVNFDSVIIILILVIGLLAHSSSFRNNQDTNKKTHATFVSMGEKNAVPESFVRLQVFQKTWISNKDNFNILAFNRSPVAENKKADLKIISLLFIRYKFSESPRLLLMSHIFPPEAEDPLHLS
jgi:hypothetical protein